MHYANVIAKIRCPMMIVNHPFDTIVCTFRVGSAQRPIEEEVGTFIKEQAVFRFMFFL